MATATSSADTRQRIMTATNELFRRQGFNGTSLSQIVKASQSTTGSVYHFFPGGKDELTAAVLRESGAAYGELVELMIRDAADPAVGMADAFAGAAAVLTSTDFIDPCPIGTIAREVANTHDALRGVAAMVMADWTDSMVAIFVDAGIAEERAHGLSTLSIAAIEGAFVLARTHRDVAGFLAVGEMLATTIRAELPPTHL